MLSNLILKKSNKFNTKFVNKYGIAYSCDFYPNIFVSDSAQINFKDYDCGFKIFKKKKLIKILKENTFDKNLITSQIFIYFKIYNNKILQLPIKYN